MEIDISRERHESQIKSVEACGERKYMYAVTNANERIVELEDRNKELDEECDELLKKLNVRLTSRGLRAVKPEVTLLLFVRCLQYRYYDDENLFNS